MIEVAERGAYPQMRGTSAPGGVVTREELCFLDYLQNLLPGELEPLITKDFRGAWNDPFYRATGDARLTMPQARFIVSYLVNGGNLIGVVSDLLLTPAQTQGLLTARPVLRILTAAAELDATIKAPIPTREELIMDWRIVKDLDYLPDAMKSEARKELAKLCDYYPKGNEGVNVGVQVILTGDLDNG